MIASPSYPDSYPNDVDCWWTLRASRGHGIRLSFHNFDIETTDHCNGDYVEVRTSLRCLERQRFNSCATGLNSHCDKKKSDI